jgi:hypothetical protein
LQRIGDAVDEILLADDSHGAADNCDGVVIMGGNAVRVNF